MPIIAWCVCIALTMLTSGWPIFDNDYMTTIWLLSGISSIGLTYIILDHVAEIDYDTQLSCAIIAIICLIFAFISASVVIHGRLNGINDDIIALSKCTLCVLLPIGVITKHIASWKSKQKK